MPRIYEGDLWAPGADLIIVTANAMLRQDGALVMGRGAAFQATKRYSKEIQFLAGNAIHNICGSGGYYGFIELDLSTVGHDTRLGLLQVKYNWFDTADLGLITQSVSKLTKVATSMPHRIFRVNYPGIGNGRLSVEEVQPILEGLPENVEVVHKGLS